MNEQKILHLLQLSKRAGKLLWGMDACLGAGEAGEALLFLTTCDISENSNKKIGAAAKARGIPLLQLAATKDQMEQALGRYCAVFALSDLGFAKGIKALF